MSFPLQIIEEDSFSAASDILFKDDLRKGHDWKLGIDWLLSRNPRIGDEIPGKAFHRVFVLPATGSLPITRIIYRYNDKDDGFRVFLVTFEFAVEHETSEEKVSV